MGFFRLDRAAFPIAIALAASLSGGAGCKKKNPAAAEVVDAKPAEAPETPVPAPDGIVAEGVIKSPDAMLGSLRTISLLIPDKAGGLFADLLHVPKEAAREIDGSKPVCFVVIQRAEATSFALSVALKDPDKAAAALAAGSFKRSDDAELGAAVFEGTSRPKNQTIAIRRKFLVASSSVEALKALAPYVTRTMPQRPPLADDVVVTVPQAAMRGPALTLWKGALDAAVEKRKLALTRGKTAGTAGAGGAPLPAMELLSEWLVRQNQRSLKWLADAGDGRLSLTTDKGSIKLRAEIAVPDPNSALGKAMAGWATQDAKPLLKAPQSSVLAFSWSESATDRATSSGDVVDLLTAAYPKDLPKDARERMAKFLAQWDAARGDFLSGALVYEDLAHVGAVLRLGAKDPKAASAMLKEALAAVLAVKGVAEGLTAADIAAPSFATATLGGVEANVLSIPMPRKKGEPTAPGAAETFDVVWGPASKDAKDAKAGGDEVLLVVGTGARDLFTRTVEGAGAADKSLATSPDLTAQLDKLGPGLAAALVVFPGRVVPLVRGSAMAAPPAPNDGVAFSVGRTSSGGFLTLDLSKPAVETLARLALMSSLR
jgi:hypothetical protein